MLECVQRRVCRRGIEHRGNVPHDEGCGLRRDDQQRKAQTLDQARRMRGHPADDEQRRQDDDQHHVLRHVGGEGTPRCAVERSKRDSKCGDREHTGNRAAAHARADTRWRAASTVDEVGLISATTRAASASAMRRT